MYTQSLDRYDTFDCLGDLPWQIMDHLSDGIVITELNRSILFANQSAREFLGLSTSLTKQELILPESGTIAVKIKGEQRNLEVSSRTVSNQGRSLILSTLRDTTNHLRQLEQLRHQSFTDELTGLYNRRGFLAVAQHQIESARRTCQNVVVVFADMDGLKVINDSLGHGAGDAAIRDLADILKRSLRAEDVMARVGGDEFVMLTIIKENESAEALIDRLQSAIDSFNENAKNRRAYSVKASFGFSVMQPDRQIELSEVIERADMEMYREKRQRRTE